MFEKWIEELSREQEVINMDFEIISDENLSFEEYYNMLIDIVRDTAHEAYMMEVILPLLRMCCVDGIKVVPVFDDRAVGRKTEEESFVKKRMKTISAPSGTSYVVPDYIFVPKDYSYHNPMKPLLMVETKFPNMKIKDDSLQYVYLSDSIPENYSQIEAEIDACKYVVFTDGFTWMFLTKDKNGKITESQNYPSISLLRKGKRNWKIYKARKKISFKLIDLKYMGEGKKVVSGNPPEWEKIPIVIKRLLEKLIPE